ncbi:MAG: cysteine desulfurase [Streptococcaceae bacterium]|jgi:cysteine desulfurase|nr:cysteine desulfurase [Streptococcaceae bacterium]
MIYLDNAATTPILPDVAEVLLYQLTENFGNPSSIHQAGRAASRVLRESRQIIAEILDVAPQSITFTSGGSESNNTAIISYALSHQQNGRHLVTTAIEHPSVRAAFDYLHTRHGFEITIVSPQADGNFPPELITAAVRPDTILVSVMHANNETGQILPVREIGAFLATSPNTAFHVDAVQTMGKMRVKPQEMGADFLSATAHKFHGPKGTGFLYHAPSVRFDSLIHGGEQEEKRRAGTENSAGIAAMAKALTLANASLDTLHAHIQNLRQRLLSALADIDYYENAFGETLASTINLGFPGKNHDALLTKLDMAGICVSTGSACTAGAVEPSHVLTAVYGKNSPKLKENIRLSLSALTTPDDIQQFTKILHEVL